MIKTVAGFPFFADRLIDANKFQTLTETEDKYLKNEIREISSIQRTKLRQKPISGNFDLEHFLSIHEFLFYKVSSSAGKMREIGIKKGSVSFAPANEIINVFKKIEPMKERLTTCRSHEQFAVVFAGIFNAINYAHPCLEGNGRTTRLFVEQLAKQFDLSLHLDNLARKDWLDACNAGFNGSLAPLASIFRMGLMSKEASEVLDLFSIRLKNKLKQENIPEENFREQYQINYKKLRETISSLSEAEIRTFKERMIYSKGKNKVIEP